MNRKHIKTILLGFALLTTLIMSSCKENETIKHHEKQKEATENLKEIGLGMKMYFNEE